MVSIREYYYDGGAERPTTKGRLFIKLWIFFSKCYMLLLFFSIILFSFVFFYVGFLY